MRWLRDILPPPLFLLIVGATWWGISIQNKDSQPPSSDIKLDPHITEEQPKNNSTAILSASVDYAQQIENIVSRPLFIENRRLIAAEIERDMPDAPIEPPKVQNKLIITVPERPTLIYKGFMHAGKTSQALIGLGSIEQESWVKAGDVVEGWKLKRIYEDHIQLEKNGLEFIVEIQR